MLYQYWLLQRWLVGRRHRAQIGTSTNECLDSLNVEKIERRWQERRSITPRCFEWMPRSCVSWPLKITDHHHVHIWNHPPPPHFILPFFLLLLLLHRLHRLLRLLRARATGATKKKPERERERPGGEFAFIFNSYSRWRRTIISVCGTWEVVGRCHDDHATLPSRWRSQSIK